LAVHPGVAHMVSVGGATRVRPQAAR
jgi:hypothetical protein